MSAQESNDRRRWAWDLEGLIWLLFQLIGVPLTMLEFWNLGKQWVVIGLLALWLPTVAFLILDFVGGLISRTSIALFLVWTALVVSYVAYTNVVV